MDFEQIKAESNERTKYSFMTANLCNNAASEMYFLKLERYDRREGYILGTFTMRFYMASLQYMFNAEFCKLFEKDSARKSQNVSSLSRLNNYHFNAIGDNFKKSYEENEEDIFRIINSDFYARQKTLRDEKYSHSDISINNDFSISPFSENDLNVIFEQMKLVIGIINRCHAIFDTEYFISIPNIGTTTQNFIKQHSKYQDYWLKNNLGATDDMLD